MSNYNWYCATCGGNNIRRDAIVEWNPEMEQYEIVSVLDNAWCEDCGELKGDPVWELPDKS